MSKIYLIGGVGAGKSTVLSILKTEYGAEIILADDEARRLMEPGEAGYDAVVRTFGTEYLSADGTIDRPKLAARIFRDPEAKKTIDQLIHPMTWKVIDEKMSASGADLVITEAAVFDADARKRFFDEVWYVRTDPEIRIERLMESRGYSEEKCRAMIGNQFTDEEYAKQADRVIDNSGTEEDVRAQLRTIMEERTKR